MIKACFLNWVVPDYEQQGHSSSHPVPDCLKDELESDSLTKTMHVVLICADQKRRILLDCSYSRSGLVSLMSCPRFCCNARHSCLTCHGHDCDGFSGSCPQDCYHCVDQLVFDLLLKLLIRLCSFLYSSNWHSFAWIDCRCSELNCHLLRSLSARPALMPSLEPFDLSKRTESLKMDAHSSSSASTAL